MGTKWSSLKKKTLHTKKTMYSAHYDSFVSGQLQRTNRKIGEMVTVSWI
jgi:hypothetical protein